MNFKDLAAQLTRLYEKLNRAQKLVIVGTLFAVIGFIVFLILYTSSARSNNYAVLFDHLSSKDAGLIIQELEKEGIPYKIPQDGVIEVPRERVYKVRINIASKGFPKESHVGFELFDQQQFGSTDFDQKVKFLRALEGELARTIQSLQPIERASVHLALPKESVFVSKQTAPSASVVVKSADGMRLSRKQILGIKNLVAAAVPNLKPENVKIVNEFGEPLSEAGEDGSEGELAKLQMQYKNRYEKVYEEKVVDVLAPFIGGKDRVVAKVTIDFDFARRNSVEERYDPENVVRSEQSMEEKREGVAPEQVGGVPGAVSNIGPVQGIESEKSKQKYQKSTTTTNYEISKTVSNIKGPFASIERVTAAVVVDGKYVPGEDGVLKYEPRSSEEIERISSLVKQAIGFDPRRGDQVTVSNFKFESTAQSLVSTPYKSAVSTFYAYIEPVVPILKYLILFLILFLFYKKVIVPFSEKMLEVPVEEAPEGETVLHLDEEEHESLTEKFTEMRKKVEEQLGLGEEFSEDELKYDILLEKVKEMAEERTDEFAALINALIRDESELEQNTASNIKKETS
ncbi:flagellar basal-body MS-ring/collar protein FliF [Hydrogenimonas cancrithermarum]|uniref:Flagellar M-ring protein n=1 Tax=Hydrogenimonas cancrithermarum TaxID=2993563 RepID=A0ABM8FLL6_9BACT|nr:flagellar basal-body MS-ring/collar protein FliF [Hydrogenimonas cancrithermarum]BDY12581.1 flagellar M-ring protein [Hydrogenimonas cancrithermarum]